jgi:hypothetical protein
LKQFWDHENSNVRTMFVDFAAGHKECYEPKCLASYHEGQ